MNSCRQKMAVTFSMSVVFKPDACTLQIVSVGVSTAQKQVDQQSSCVAKVRCESLFLRYHFLSSIFILQTPSVDIDFNKLLSPTLKSDNT